MADEKSKPPYNKPSAIPEGLDWESLLKRDGDELEAHYRNVLAKLGKEKGLLGVIFRKAQNKIQDPAKLRRLIADLIDREQWTALDADVKGDAYEGLLEKNAADVKSGAGETIRRKLLHECDVHTLLRLPTGIFYSQGVKANVLFFDRKPASEKPWSQRLWIYDLRTNQHFTLKENPLKRSDLDDFVTRYNPKNRHKREESERFKSFSYDDLVKRDKANLDICWLKDESLEDSANLPDPDVIAEEITEDLESALEQFSEIQDDLKKA